MIEQSQQKTTLRVCLEDVGTHNKAVLDFFFAKLGKDAFYCVDSQHETNVLIIDYDFPPARMRYENEYRDWQKPAIILSISEVSLDNTVWLPKPLTSRALLDAAASVQKLLTSEPVATNAPTKLKENAVGKLFKEALPLTTPKPSSTQRPEIKPTEPQIKKPLVEVAPSTTVTPDVAPTSAPVPDNSLSTSTSDLPLVAQEESIEEEQVLDVVADEAQEARWELLCGTQADVDRSTNLASIQSEESFFLSSVKDAVRLARQCQQGVLLSFPQTKIYVLPEIHRIFCTIPLYSVEFEQLIQKCDSGEGGKMHILSTPEIHELNDLILQQSDALYDLESFVWTSTLLSAHGVLPRALDPNKAVGLKHWPGITRIESFPHVMPIAAQWSAQAMSAFDVAKSLNIPQRYVFSFYNAANNLGLIEMDPDKLIKKQSTPRATEAPRGLFSRLLKRLVGG